MSEFKFSPGQYLVVCNLKAFAITGLFRQSAALCRASTSNAWRHILIIMKFILHIIFYA